MRILITSDYLNLDNLGGSGRVILELTARLAARGFQVEVLAGGSRAGRRPVSVGEHEIPWTSFHYPTEGVRGLGFFFRTRRAVRAAYLSLGGGADLLLHNQPFTTFAIGPVPLPAIYLFHSPWPLEYVAERFGGEDVASARGRSARARFDIALRRHLEARAVGRMERVITLSEAMKAHALALHRLPPERLEVLPGGVDLERFEPGTEETRAEARRRHGISPTECLLVAVRRLVPRTGVDRLLEALAMARDAIPAARLLIAGSGPMRCALERRAAALGLAERVRFLGYVSEAELPDLYRAADLAVTPTRALEGFGLATLEALACGTPVAATPVGGSPEILAPLAPELLARDGSAVSIADVLVRWGRDGAGLAELRPRCRAHVEERYSWDRFASGIARIAEEVSLAPLQPAAVTEAT